MDGEAGWDAAGGIGTPSPGRNSVGAVFPSGRSTGIDGWMSAGAAVICWSCCRKACSACSCNCRFRISRAFRYVSIRSGTCGGRTCNGIVGSMPDGNPEGRLVGAVIDGNRRGMQAQIQRHKVPAQRQVGVVSMQPAGVKGFGGLTDVLQLSWAATGKANTTAAARARIVFILRP